MLSSMVSPSSMVFGDGKVSSANEGEDWSIYVIFAQSIYVIYRYISPFKYVLMHIVTVRGYPLITLVSEGGGHTGL